MWRALYHILDTLIVIICLPFYAVAVPALAVYQWLLQRRPVSPGLEVTHWPFMDVREDYLVVDVSRVDEGLVGIRRRRWCTLRAKGAPPPYSDHVEYIEIGRFWVPKPQMLIKR